MNSFTLSLVSVMYVVRFFFFKQKTAYEMRISDWSSDVCSSDLDAGISRRKGADRAARRILSAVQQLYRSEGDRRVRRGARASQRHILDHRWTSLWQNRSAEFYARRWLQQHLSDARLPWCGKFPAYCRRNTLCRNAEGTES